MGDHFLLVVHDERLSLTAGGDLQAVLVSMLHLVAKRDEELAVQPDGVGGVRVALLQALLQIQAFGSPSISLYWPVFWSL